MLDCSIIDEMNLDEWSLKLLGQLNGKRYPLAGMIELTDRCNLGCVHCYINQASNCQASRETELTADQWKGILDQMAEAGCLYLTFTGGEVFLRPDFLEIYNHARNLGMLVTIFTNGTLITPRIADELARHAPRNVEITLYGATRETYEQITGVPGSYDRCMAGIRLLRERKINVNLKTILMKINLHELPQLRSMAEESGGNFRYDGLLWPRLDGGETPFDYRVSMEELIHLDLSDEGRLSEWLRIYKTTSGPLSRSEYVFSCGAALRSFLIDSKGSLVACTMARQPSFDLHQMSFSEAWKSIGMIREIKREKETKCQSCTLGGLCYQCPGWSQGVHNDNETPVEYVCKLAHLRAKILESEYNVIINQEEL